jgi:hypothetical protein
LRTFTLIFTLSLLGVVSGCSVDLPFQRGNPGGNSVSSDRDYDNCRREADRSMNESLGSDAFIDPADDHTENPMIIARREQLRSQYQKEVAQCMGR